MGSALGIWQMMEANDIAQEQNNLTQASMISSAEESARAEAKANQAEKEAIAGKTAKAQTPDLEKMENVNSKKRGVQSTFTATTGSGAGMMKNTTLTPIGG